MGCTKMEQLENNMKELEYRTAKLEETVKFVMKVTEQLIAMHTEEFTEEFQVLDERSPRKVKVNSKQ